MSLSGFSSSAQFIGFEYHSNSTFELSIQIQEKAKKRKTKKKYNRKDQYLHTTNTTQIFNYPSWYFQLQTKKGNRETPIKFKTCEETNELNKQKIKTLEEGN